MTTIAIGLPTKLSDEQKARALSIAEQFGYGLSFDLAGAEGDVRDGLKQAAEKLDWRDFIFLHVRLPREVAFADHDAALASGIQEELIQYELSGVEPEFFQFLMDIESEIIQRLESYWVVFAGEWYRDERIRIEEGRLQDLISLLRKPANWQQRLLVVAIGETQDSDEIPLIFKVHVPDTKAR